MTKDEAQKWLRDQSINLEHGFDFQGSKITLGDYLPQWLEKSKGALREKTAYHYNQVMNKHILPYLGKVKLADLRLLQIETFYSKLSKAGVGVRTIHICHSILHKALEKALRYKLLIYNPAKGAELPRYIHTEMNILDGSQISLLLIAAQACNYHALYHLAVTTGMRQGELFGLKWIDLQWESGVVHVQRQVQTIPGKKWSFVDLKTKAAKRTIKLGEGSLQILREHFLSQSQHKELIGDEWQDNGLIFPSTVGSPGNASNLRVDFNKTLDKAGISRIRFHDLRHTAASLMLNNNVPIFVVSKILGHSKPSITLDIYGHLLNEMQEGAADIMDILVTPIPIQLPMDRISFKN